MKRSPAVASTLGCLLCLYHLAVHTAADDRDDQLCYDMLGCFSRLPPFDHAGGFMPEAPETIATELRLYTPGRDEPETLNYLDPESVNAAEFDPFLPTKFIIHGFGNSLDESDWISEMKKAFQEHRDYNIILVGWNAAFPNYLQAAANTRVVGRTVAKVIEDLVTIKGLNLSTVHIIGHSLGAHVSGYVGRHLSSKVARITGLDPAGPNFESHPEDVRLDPGDALFVDVIHSNGQYMDLSGGFGMAQAAGHVDFYPNGGAKQPGCVDGVGGGLHSLLWNLLRIKLDDLGEEVVESIACSHGRAYEIFTESIRAANSWCRFKSLPCSSYADFNKGKCLTCGPQGCNFAGLEANPKMSRGLQFFHTNDRSPLCGQSYLVSIVPGGETNELRGNIWVGLQGDIGTGGDVIASGQIHMSRNEPFTRIATIDKNVGRVSRVILIYKRGDILARRQMDVDKITIEPLGGDQRFSTSSRNIKLSTHKYVVEEVTAEKNLKNFISEKGES